MQKALLYKSLGILALILLMSVAISYVNGLILERQARQASVESQIAKSSVASQTLTGPIMSLPYTERYTETIGSGKDRRTLERTEHGVFYLLPESLVATGDFQHHYKQLGIFRTLLYQFNGELSGSFDLRKINIQAQHSHGSIEYGPAVLTMGISDTRGIDGQTTLLWNQQSLPLKQGTQLQLFNHGIHASIGNLDLKQAQSQSQSQTQAKFKLNLHLRGMQHFNLIPLADKNKLHFRSTWQHPHFDGHFLPDAATQRISNKGFDATWEVSSLASNIQEKLLTALQQGVGQLDLETVSIGLIEPVNIYSLSDRATKYGLLFIGLTFAGFYLFELMKQLRIHPAQYTLVGLAMALFYLLLISLAEHIGFSYAYLAASTACIGLIAYYLSAVMHSHRNGVLIALNLGLLYGTLYGILISEDNAMLMGSALIFSILAFTMIATRKLDWYSLSDH